MTPMTSIGIRAIGTSIADREMSSAQLAEVHGVPEEAVRRIIHGDRIHVSDETAESFGVRAARQCLERAGLGPDAVDVVIWCNGSKRAAPFAQAAMIQDALGAKRAFAVDLGENCSEFLMGLRVARGLLRDNEDLEHVLVVSGEQWAEYVPTRTLEPITGKNYQNIMSDGGCATLVARTDRSVLTGFGFATNGRYWDLLQPRFEVRDGKVAERVIFKPNFPDDKQLALDLTQLFRLGLERCLKSAGITAVQIDHVILPFSGPPMQVGFARALALPPAKIVRTDGGPTHIGAPDMIHALEMLYASGRGQPGQHVLFAARSIGIMRCGMLRL